MTRLIKKVVSCICNIINVVTFFTVLFHLKERSLPMGMVISIVRSNRVNEKVAGGDGIVALAKEECHVIEYISSASESNITHIRNPQCLIH